jgi:hypothetical protein
MSKKVELKPLTENALKQVIMDLDALNAEYKALDKRYEALEVKIMATLKPKDVRQYDDLRCTIVQAMRRTVNWKAETWSLARKVYTTPKAFKGYLVYLVKTYKKKPIKPSIKLTRVKIEEN